ncbi:MULTISPECIES: helix-turn-helix domain-containing protein [unclassified Aureimonas]|uniref:helix-turn-helix domain-containing protein n=1 Tax=unclassified Aureimonas TaxID=2615206 RepID=UPI00138F9010|nr:MULTISPECIES: helix-turn-helix transcriptional regulator [unclassified Aureimonas]
MSAFGKRLRDLRKRAGLGQAEVALRLGVSTAHLYALECDRSPATVATLQGLVAVIPMTPTERAELTDAWSTENRRFRVDIEDAASRRVVARLVVGLGDLTDDDLTAISDVLDRRAA